MLPVPLRYEIKHNIDPYWSPFHQVQDLKQQARTAWIHSEVMLDLGQALAGGHGGVRRVPKNCGCC